LQSIPRYTALTRGLGENQGTGKVTLRDWLCQKNAKVAGARQMPGEKAQKATQIAVCSSHRHRCLDPYAAFPHAGIVQIARNFFADHAKSSFDRVSRQAPSLHLRAISPSVCGRFRRFQFTYKGFIRA
jgi:hypothetical protein